MPDSAHVLIAAHDPGMRDFLETALTKRSGYRVSKAMSGTEAVRILAGDRPNGALVDVLLPEISIEAVARAAATERVPVVFLVRDPRSLSDLDVAGCPYLVPPMSVEKVVHATSQLIGQRAEYLRRLELSLGRLQKTAVTLHAAVQTKQRVQEVRSQRGKATGPNPQLRSRLRALEDWVIVRAAQHMVDSYGARAETIANERASTAEDAGVEKKWRAIAATIRTLRAERN